ncbi:MAG: hypothetical protein QGI18_09090 [Candidatus Marinimicrobia bacterium]|nr:hypothetical protein [Candidatus Neomarinimicrobiota bacterium]
MDTVERKKYSDLIELGIVFAFLFMIITIYVPSMIWVEEEEAAESARFNIQTVHDIEYFYRILTDDYEPDGLWALNVVNAVRDSVLADSTYLGERNFELIGENVSVNIPEGFDVEYDTTFGFLKTRRDTLIDTIHTVVLYSEELSRNDTSFVTKNDLSLVMIEEGFVSDLGFETKQRSEVVSYYDSYIPDSSNFYCPLTNEKIVVNIKDDGDIVRISSPIEGIYSEGRYLLFSFKTRNHGYIEDGSRSWDQ